MAKGIYIVGTDTDAGKTVVSAGIMHVLRNNGYNAVYFKPALSGAIKEGKNLIPGDTRFVCHVSGIQEDYNIITPYIYENAVSPHLASRLENNPIDIDIVKKKLNILKDKYEYIVAEGSGGIACPLIEREDHIYFLYDFIKDLDINVVLVCRASLGTINHTILSVDYMRHKGINVKGIIVNDYSKSFMTDDNINIIKKATNVPILGVLPHIEDVNVEKLCFGDLKKKACENLQVQDILEAMNEF